MSNRNFERDIETRRIKVFDVDIDWYCRIGDHAFESILQGFIDEGREKCIKHLNSKGSVIQAGGYCGIFPYLLSDIFKWVYTFEPDPWSFHCLVNNCQRTNIFKFNAALGAENSLVGIDYAGIGNPGGNRINRSDRRIPQFKIDNLDLDECSLIILDLEGYEDQAIQGALRLIEKFHPVVILEDGKDAHLELLKPFGYSQIDNCGRDVIYK